MRHLFQLSVFLLAGQLAFGQQDSSGLSTQPVSSHGKPGKRPNIIVQTMDGTRIKGRVDVIGYDYIIMDASKHNSVVELNKYYIRPYDGNFKIDVNYINKAMVNKGRVLGQSAINWAVGAGVLLGIAGYNIAKSENEGEFWTIAGGTMLGGGIGFVAGGFVGSLIGLVKRKTIAVNGNPANLEKVRVYFY